jgi:hypothetical protein
MSIKVYCNKSTPEALYSRAFAEFTWWSTQSSFFMPPKAQGSQPQRWSLPYTAAWLKIGFKDRIVEFLEKYYSGEWQNWGISWDTAKLP